MTGASAPILATPRVIALRRTVLVLGVIAWLVVVAPPVLTWARRYEYVQAIQYCVLAVVSPALIVIGAPWRVLRLSSGEPVATDGEVPDVTAAPPRWADRLATVRARHPGHRRAIAEVVVFGVVAILWRIAPVGNALVHHPWLAVVEGLTLGVVGVALWLDLVESPPLSPGAPRPYRIGMSAAAMWTIWVFAYLFAQSHDSWYPAFHHVAGRGVSLSADQQLSAGVLWFLSAAAFLPVIFWNLVHWLQSEEDPDDELYRLVRDQKTLGYDANS